MDIYLSATVGIFGYVGTTLADIFLTVFFTQCEKSKSHHINCEFRRWNRDGSREGFQWRITCLIPFCLHICFIYSCSAMGILSIVSAIIKFNFIQFISETKMYSSVPVFTYDFS